MNVYSGAARGGGEGDERGEIFPPCYDRRDTFSIRTIKYCNLSLSTFNENKQFTCFGESIPGLQEPNLGLEGPYQDQEGPSEAPESPSKGKWAKSD